MSNVRDDKFNEAIKTGLLQLPEGWGIKWTASMQDLVPSPPAKMLGLKEMLDLAEAEETKSITCECGKDKHGFANHSTWCPKS